MTRLNVENCVNKTREAFEAHVKLKAGSRKQHTERSHNSESSRHHVSLRLAERNVNLN
jgi:hypothetical protein